MAMESDKSRFGAFQRYPRNAWYVAAGGAVITDKPLARLLLDTPVVLYRGAGLTRSSWLADFRSGLLIRLDCGTMRTEPRGENT